MSSIEYMFLAVGALFFLAYLHDNRIHRKEKRLWDETPNLFTLEELTRWHVEHVTGADTAEGDPHGYTWWTYALNTIRKEGNWKDENLALRAYTLGFLEVTRVRDEAMTYEGGGVNVAN